LTGLTVAGNLTVTGQTINHLVIENNGDAAIAPAVGDENTYFVTTHATAVVTLPQDSAQDFEIGTVMYFERNGTGTLTFAAGTGASVTSKDSTLTCADRYTTVAAVKVSADGWSLIGNIG
jgi:predicted RecA/RadA family phage recombinase